MFTSEIERLNIEIKQGSGNTAIIHEYEEKIVMLTSEIERLNDVLRQYREDNNIVQSQVVNLKESRMTIEQQLALARSDAEAWKMKSQVKNL
jgi:small-conductance mechanosensitive channel